MNPRKAKQKKNFNRKNPINQKSQYRRSNASENRKPAKNPDSIGSRIYLKSCLLPYASHLLCIEFMIEVCLYRFAHKYIGAKVNGRRKKRNIHIDIYVLLRYDMSPEKYAKLRSSREIDISVRGHCCASVWQWKCIWGWNENENKNIVMCSERFVDHERVLLKYIIWNWLYLNFSVHGNVAWLFFSMPWRFYFCFFVAEISRKAYLLTFW